MATANPSWASAEMEPKLIAPVQNRFTISLAGSTSSMETGPPFVPSLNSIKPRNAQRALVSPLMWLENCWYESKLFMRAAV